MYKVYGHAVLVVRERLSELGPFIFPELVVADRASVMDILQAGDAEWDQTTATGNVWRKDMVEYGIITELTLRQRVAAEAGNFSPPRSKVKS